MRVWTEHVYYSYKAQCFLGWVQCGFVQVAFVCGAWQLHTCGVGCVYTCVCEVHFILSLLKLSAQVYCRWDGGRM